MQSQRVFLTNPLNAAYIQKKGSRPVFQEMSVSGLWGLFAVFVIVAVLFAVYAIPAWRTWVALNNMGAAIQGQVVDIRFEDRNVSYFYVSYNFDVDNQWYQNEQKVSFSQYDMVLDAAQSIPVRYAINDPTISQLDAPFENFGDLRIPVTYFGGGFLLLLLAALLIHSDRRMQNSALVTKGKLVKGNILTSYGNRPDRDSTITQILTLLFLRGLYYLRRRGQSEFRVKVRYKFISPVSQKEITKTETIVRNDLDRRSVPEPGTPVAVLFRTDRHFRLL